jgi:CRISPR system Cascade subunit CasE
MYLSRLILNPRSRQVRSELANPYEMHRTVMNAFAGWDTSQDRILFRLEMRRQLGLPVLLVQSPLEPRWNFLTAPEKNYLLPAEECPSGIDQNLAVKTFELNLLSGDELAFRLRANPSVKKDRQGKKQGRRVGLYREEDQLKWLERKLDAAGARLVSARTSNEAKINAAQKSDQAHNDLTFLAVLFDGGLMVSYPERLWAAVKNGIGSGKGLGLGLLSLARYSG